ncbi:hypothetical protein [Flavobacterium muglaense]|uniref:SPOR domain-containing protein n=1 Tax=Flavobacterium muglaense TaxID=2764716 RepID=A0A923SF77_9FLAO|nr:hypothetical protein [Flavobacterium muglaense]MBC5837863.1 hypothetical protein [Flavobacterium muglaense]MBC5844332.1 hypothetical protein [Flavobacterium muglaense]
MKYIKIIIALLLVGFSNGSAAQSRKADKDTQAWRYEVEAVQTGVQGTYLIKVWSYSKNPDVATEQAKKNAVHGIIFKGFTGISGVPGQSPLANSLNVENEKEDFFKPFFKDGGNYMKYVSLSNDGAVGAEDRMKIGKEYKIGVIVAVNITELRKDLEKAGVIKSLTSGF